MLELWLLGALTLLAFALRLSHLDESLVGDEMYAYAEIHGRSLGGVIDAVRGGGENSPPLFFVLGWAGTKLGDPTVTIRLPSLLLGTATVPLTYLIGVRTLGSRAGVFAAALLAVSPFAIFYSERGASLRHAHVLRRALHARPAVRGRHRAPRLVGGLRGVRLPRPLRPLLRRLRPRRARRLGALGSPRALAPARGSRHRPRHRLSPLAGRLPVPEGQQHLDPRLLRPAQRSRRGARAAAAVPGPPELPRVRAARPRGRGGAGRGDHRRGARRGARGRRPCGSAAAARRGTRPRGGPGDRADRRLPGLQRARAGALHRPLPERRAPLHRAPGRRRARLARPRGVRGGRGGRLRRGGRGGRGRPRGRAPQAGLQGRRPLHRPRGASRRGRRAGRPHARRHPLAGDEQGPRAEPRRELRRAPPRAVDLPGERLGGRLLRGGPRPALPARGPGAAAGAARRPGGARGVHADVPGFAAAQCPRIRAGRPGGRVRRLGPRRRPQGGTAAERARGRRRPLPARGGARAAPGRDLPDAARSRSRPLPPRAAGYSSFVYPSPADASAALEGIERFLAAAGGQSKLLHDVVIGYTAKPAKLARDRAERCA